MVTIGVQVVIVCGRIARYKMVGRFIAWGYILTLTADDLKTEYLKLLDEEHNEQVYQKYLEQHTRLIPREFVQNHGIGCDLVLRKLSFGSDYKSDFFYFSKSSDDWNAVHIEIEKPSSKYFKGSTSEFDPGFLHAIQQINDWRAWFARDNQKGFLNSLAAIQVPTHMAIRNPTFNKYVLVYGRRDEYSGSDIRRSKIQSLETDDFKIISFDSLAEGLKSKDELSIAIRHNEYIDIVTDEITNSEMYGWIDPTQFRVSATLHDKLKNGPPSRTYRGFKNGVPIEAHQYAAENIRIRRDKDVVEGAEA